MQLCSDMGPVPNAKDGQGVGGWGVGGVQKGLGFRVSGLGARSPQMQWSLKDQTHTQNLNPPTCFGCVGG